MIVMNDRSQAGSAYHPGRIELMIHRQGGSSDGLGVNEPMRDLYLGNPVNASLKFF